MGSGCKSDPTRVQIGDISDTVEDPLSRSTRRGLRARGIESGVKVVFSTEKPTREKAKLLPLPEEEFQKGSVDELSALPNFRVRILPVVGIHPPKKLPSSSYLTPRMPLCLGSPICTGTDI